MVDIEYGIESDSDDEEEYRLEDENTIDNPVNNATSGNVVIVDLSPEQSVNPGSRCYCNRMTMITSICFTWPLF